MVQSMVTWHYVIGQNIIVTEAFSREESFLSWLTRKQRARKEGVRDNVPLRTPPRPVTYFLQPYHTSHSFHSLPKRAPPAEDQIFKHQPLADHSGSIPNREFPFVSGNAWLIQFKGRVYVEPWALEVSVHCPLLCSFWRFGEEEHRGDRKYSSHSRQ